MRRVYSLIERAAPTEANVLILGENGTGKELVARELHGRSRRSNHVFVSVDLGAVAENLFESELFGHVKGAFTDARGDRIGRLQAADGGTLFLDEVGNLPLHLQPKLLTALEQRQVVPVGANKPVPIDVRVVAATNLPPDRLGDESLFRQDLLFRLNTVEIELPPLRDRREDVPLLIDHYVALYSKKYGKPAREVPADVLAALQAYDWPGNVRALRHAAERAVILAGDGAFTVEDFSLSRGRAASGRSLRRTRHPATRSQPRARREADGRGGAQEARLQHLARRPGARPHPSLPLPPNGQAWPLGRASLPGSPGAPLCCSPPRPCSPHRLPWRDSSPPG
jgi:DNA-binding NtrC family response regulator